MSPLRPDALATLSARLRDTGRALRHPASRAFTAGPNGIAGDGDELDTQVRSAIVATVAIGDVDGDGAADVIAATPATTETATVST